LYCSDHTPSSKLTLDNQLFINEVVLGTMFGIIIGPYCAGIFNPRVWLAEHVLVTREITRIVLATGLFAIGVDLPAKYMVKHAKSLLAFVVPTMAIGWGIVAGR
jgi:sodium/hydrogen antiporter